MIYYCMQIFLEPKILRTTAAEYGEYKYKINGLPDYDKLKKGESKCNSVSELA